MTWAKVWQKHWFVLSFFAAVAIAIFTRFYHATQFPPSLYWEEAALGYDAYSILQTGKDHHGNPWPVVAFESFGDYKPSLYFYMAVPSIALFGLSEFAVRFPSMLAGVLIVVGVGMIGRKIFASQHMQVLAMLVTAVSPWAIQFSRAAWEVNLATCLITWGVYFSLPTAERKYKNFVLGFFFLALSMYAYHAARVIAPLLGMSLLVMWLLQDLKKLRQVLPKVLLVGVFFTFMISPILLSFGNKSTGQRFAETNIFANGELVARSNQYRDLAGNSFLSKLFYHRFVLYFFAFTENYFKHFSFDFLFVSGDQNVRHSVQFVGTLYLMESVFLLLGFYAGFKHWEKEYGILLFWLLIGIIPAAVTKAAPHGLRILPTMPVFMLVISLGIYEACLMGENFLKNFVPKKFVVPTLFIVIFALYTSHFFLFWRFYSLVYPKLYSQEWQYGYKEMISTVQELQKQHPDLPVFISRQEGRPAMYYWFYTKTDPREVQATQATAKKDQGEFLEFKNIKFVNTADEINTPGVFAVTNAEMGSIQLQNVDTATIKAINNLRGQTTWVVGKK